MVMGGGGEWLWGGMTKGKNFMGGMAKMVWGEWLWGREMVMGGKDQTPVDSHGAG